MHSLLLRLIATVVITSALCVAYGCSAALAQAKSIVAAPMVRRDPVLAPIPREHLHGHWVMGADNHAYWCWGPNVVLGSWNEMPRAYALDCVGSHSMVLLHD